jgi:hypothetical protein
LLKGDIEFHKLAGMQRILATTTNSVSQSHTISYSNIESLDPADVFHELCRAKLDELGFKSIEEAALSAIKDCCKDDPKYIVDANAAVVVVSEVYSNYFLFSYFSEESEARRQEMISRFESSDALTSLHTRMGFWGTAGLAYYKIASQWAGRSFPTERIEAAIKRAGAGTVISEELEKIEPVLQELPRVKDLSALLSEIEQISMVDLITKLFSAKTDVKCN